MKRVFIAFLVACLVAPLVMAAPSTPASAKTVNAGDNVKLWRKLKKNAWSSKPNPDSEIATRGYALYKIYNALMDDGILENFYWNDDAKNEKYGKEGYLEGYKKIVASTKKQKKAIQWMLNNGAYDDYNYESGTVFQGKDQISRVELANMFASVMVRFYPSQLEDLPLGSTYYKPDRNHENKLWCQVQGLPFDKGIIVGENLYLQEYATLEDVSRAVKNFKLVLANRIKVVYRDTPVEQTSKVVDKEISQILKYFDSLGIDYYQPNANNRYYRLGGNLGSSSEFCYVSGSGWEFRVSFGGFGEYQRFMVKGEEIDIVKTIKRIFSVRYEIIP